MKDSIPLKLYSTISGNSAITPFLLLLFIVLFPIHTLYAQNYSASNNNEAIIDTVVIEGNRVTKDFVILSEIALKPGMAATEEAIKWDRGRLESLRLFTKASVELIQNDKGQNVLLIQVTELWYIWPGIMVDFDENDPSRNAFGFILSHDNFRGRRELLSISARKGYISGFQLDWDIPYISSKNPDWSLHAKGKFVTEEEPRYIEDRANIQTEEKSVQLRIAYRINLQNSVWLNAKIISRDFETLNDETSLNKSLTEKSTLGILVVGRSYDTRSYRPWPENGQLFDINAAFGMGLRDNKTTYVQPLIKYSSFYSPLKSLHVAANVSGNALIGSLPAFSRLLIDKDNGIRTPMSRTLSGTWRISSKLEIRKDILPITYLTYKSFEFIQPYTRDLKFGVSLSSFVDSAVIGGDGVRDGSESYTNDWELAYGLALVFHIPYRDLIKIEVGRSARFPSDGLLFQARIGSSF